MQAFRPQINLTDRTRSSLSEMLLYAEHPFHPIHASLFSNYDGTLSLVVSARNGEVMNQSLWISLALDGEPFARTLFVTLRGGRGLHPIGKVTFEDLGEPFTCIHFETARPLVRAVCQ